MEQLIFQSLGIKYYDLDTPALLIDVDLLISNIQKFNNLAETADISIIPYSSIHGSKDILKYQLQGNKTLNRACTNSISEAEELVDLGLQKLTIKSTPISKNQIQRLWALSQNTHVDVVVTDPQHVTNFQQACPSTGESLGIIIQPVSQSPDREKSIITIIESCLSSPNIQYKGLLLEESLTLPKEDYSSLIKLIRSKWPESEIIALGEFSVKNLQEIHLVDYLIAGCYPVPDIPYLVNFPELSISASVLSQIISKPTREHLVIDSGHKTFGTDLGIPSVIHDTEHEYSRTLKPLKFSAEHGAIKFDEDQFDQITVQDKIRLLPNSMELCFNQFDMMRFVQSDTFIGYKKITGRGLYS